MDISGVPPRTKTYMSPPRNLVYFPHVEESLKPKLEMQFDSLKEAYMFYNSYAKSAGFSVRSSQSKHRKSADRNKVLCWKQFVCYKEGVSILKGVHRYRGITRDKCRAIITLFKRVNWVRWAVSSFVEEHTHALATPRKRHFLRSQRKVTSTRRALFRSLGEANILTSQQHRIMAIQSGGIENIGCTKKDMYNIERDLKEELKGYDAETLLEYFNLEKEKNSSFVFEFEKDEKDRLVRCFWADAASRNAYANFGDAVVFDTTYRTNKYGMVFAPLMGINHHDQTVLFGCGFLSNERLGSFDWLFDRWLQSMGRGPPKIIITDQDLAMTKAIANKLPQTYHSAKKTCYKYCIWHIMQKFPMYLGPEMNKECLAEFSKVVYHSESTIAFEQDWMDLLTKYKLWDNEWLTDMFEIRDKWVVAYAKPIFAVGMSSSQKAESLHRFLKRHILAKISLTEFMIRFNRALLEQRQNEVYADHIDMNEKPVMKALMPMEKQMAVVYTKTIFRKFQDQLMGSNAYVFTQCYTDMDEEVYEVSNVYSNTNKDRRMTYKVRTRFASCSCRKFAFEGIPCRHIVALLRIKQVYILS